MSTLHATNTTPATPPSPDLPWSRIAYHCLVSRALDALEETRLLPEKLVLYQFSARGHEVSQSILGALLTHRHDGVGAYYRSRPLLLSLGISVDDALAGPMGKSGSYSDGRDIGVVANLPGKSGATVLPISGDVGSQYTPAVGWAQAALYRRDVLADSQYDGAIACILGGDASVATNGFWSALTISTTQRLPVLFVIEDNGFGISVPSTFQTPGGDIAANLAAFSNLTVVDTDVVEISRTVESLFRGITIVRSGNGPALVRIRVPRLSGHSGQDTQAYKSKECLADEQLRDPLPRLREHLVPQLLSEESWSELEAQAARAVDEAFQRVVARADPDCALVQRYVRSEYTANGELDLQQQGGVLPEGHRFPLSSDTPTPEPTRINMLTAIRRTLEHELATNPKLLLFGEDVGPKGGVHAATLGLQESFGSRRVFDTSLSEEGIIGRAVGMAIAGLIPVAEIQFRKYADPATEQLNNCGTMRWRTANRFAAPIVVRMPGGFAKCGDPWHSVCGEVMWAHGIGWQVAFPSNAEDAVGLLRAAMRSNDPTIFFEHRAMLDAAWARRPYPGDAYVLPFGKSRTTRVGQAITVVTWGAMVERCELAASESGVDAEVIDLRTIVPWDKEGVLTSLTKTRRCLIVHEDGMTAGFGAEIAATVAREGFFSLDAPITRLCVPDVPIPYNTTLMDAVIPSVKEIAEKMKELVSF
jgi:2-oxoisovalerate dehydrogenase E1 component